MLTETSEYVMIIARWGHILGASTWLGISLTYAFVIAPLRLSYQSHEELFKTINIRYKEIVDLSVIVIFISGLIMTFDRLTGLPPPTTWTILLGSKVVLAILMVYLIWNARRSGPIKSSNFIMNGIGRIFGYNATIILGVVIFLLASWMRTVLEVGV